jgi:hypothetical protein
MCTFETHVLDEMRRPAQIIGFIGGSYVTKNLNMCVMNRNMKILGISPETRWAMKMLQAGRAFDLQ